VGVNSPPHPNPLLLRQAQDGEPVEPHGGERENFDRDYFMPRNDYFFPRAYAHTHVRTHERFSVSKPRIQGITESVTQQVETQHSEQDSKPR